MEKVYAAHEKAYQNLKKKGASSWNEMYSTPKDKEVDHVGIERQRFIDNILEKDWAPKSGKALEIGCGTGPLIRWITEKGFSGTGIDISETAIELAKQQSEGLEIDLFKDDYCYSRRLKDNSFDIIADGHCFHCIVEDNDRKMFLEKSRDLLKKDGVFILLTMCSPINRKQFSIDHKTAKFINKRFYSPYDSELEGSRIINGKMYMSQRRIEHWKDILKSVKAAGFNVRLFNYEQNGTFSRIYLAATLS